MKRLIKLSIALSVVAALLIPATAEAKTYNPHHGPTYKVKSYTTKKGKYVPSYHRTKANHTTRDNLYFYP